MEAVSRFSRQGLCHHEKLSYLQDGQTKEFELCQNCLTEVCLPFDCNHTKTEILAAMHPISWSAILVETEGEEDPSVYPKIVNEKTHVASTDGEDVMQPLWNWLKSLRSVIYEAWQGSFSDVNCCVMSEEEKKAHAEATKCYVCLESFKEPNGCGEEEEDVIDFVINGEKVQKKARKGIKVLDHSHRTAAYRGLKSSYLTIFIIIPNHC